jgi:HPt (histidine-containing phosphotransfer) domain-containing protein
MKAYKNLVNQPVNDINNNVANNISSESTNKTLENLLKPFGGNEHFYRRLIKIFETNLDQQLQNLDKMIEQKNTKELFAIVHTLKGSSGSAGLSSLHRALCDWEVTLKQAADCANTSTNLSANLSASAEISSNVSPNVSVNKGANSFEMLCAELLQQLRFVSQTELSSIHALLLKPSPIKAAEAPQHTAQYPISELRVMLAELKLHLEDSNLKALELAVLLQNRLSEHVTLEHDITVLCDAVEILDFEQALIALSSLEQQL